MELKTLTYIVVGATFALYILIALMSRAGSTGEFYIAGKSVPPLANGMATLLSIYRFLKIKNFP